MLREQFINFLEAALVLLLLTNAFSTLMAVYAISIACGRNGPNTQPALLKLFAWATRR